MLTVRLRVVPCRLTTLLMICVVFQFFVILGMHSGFVYWPIKGVYNGNIKPNQPMSVAVIQPISVTPSLPDRAGIKSLTYGKTSILILTYMRSGSTFTANLLAKHPDSLLFYEPLHKISYDIKTNKSIYLLNETEALYSVERLNEVSESILTSYLSCKMNHPFCTAYRDSFTAGGKKEYAKCLRQMKHVKKPCLITTCLKILENQCMAAKHVIVKTIRASMEILDTILSSVPNLKVIHLVRDPRPTIRSQLKHTLKKMTLEKYVASYCSRVSNDINIASTLEDKFPERLLRIRYEDLSLYPIDTTKKMYHFAGMSFIQSIEKYVWNVTYAGNECQKKGFQCTTRSNATTNMLIWRTKMNYKTIQTIQEECKEVMVKLGYLSASTEEIVKDLSHSLLV